MRLGKVTNHVASQPASRRRMLFCASEEWGMKETIV